MCLEGFDWEAMNRHHEQGFISDPRSKAKSVSLRLAELCKKLFSLNS